MKIVQHLERQIPPEAHTPMYNWHKYWSRKTWNVVSEFIKTYCPDDGIVFDPFSGSGVTALEALKAGRRVVACDLLPVSTEILRLTVKPVSITKLHEAFKRIESKVKDKINSFYLTKCRKCGYEFPFTCSIWKQERLSSDTPIIRECVDIRYIGCPKCGDRREKNTPLEIFDKSLLKEIENKIISKWYPKNPLYHFNGKPFKEKQRFESLDELFTKRNLLSLSLLMNAIEEESNKDLRDFLKIGFTSIVHLCSALLPEGRTGYRPFSGVGWNQQSYWFSPEFMESNVWLKFENSIMGSQGLKKAKEETNRYYQDVTFANSYSEVLNKTADIFIYTGSCFDLMREMYNDYGSKGCIDYIFTDPPYDASVQYSELAYLWVAWLKKDTGYLEKVATDEVIRNEKQDKNFDVYHLLLSRSFRDMYGVLKQNKYLTVTFHNPTFKIRNATIYAGVYAGFEFQKIHHQELARPSAKSLLQPFGSAQGDFYLRFHKTQSGVSVVKPEKIDEKRFEKIVIETTIKILAERNEPTPYTIIINAVDPELARRGFFSELHTGFDIKTVLQNHLDDEFILLPKTLGGTEGFEWWFKDPNIVKRLTTIPLSERVEQTVLRKLQELGKVTFTDVWNAVSVEFPNSHTTDSMSIKEALEAYAKPISQGYWLIKSNLKPKEIEKEHTTMIAMLAEIGQALKYKIWIGKIEQTHKINSMFIKKTGELKQFITYTDINRLKNIQNPPIVDDIDLLWIKDNKVEMVFEIESTTSMTSALQRGSNVDEKVQKFIAIPYDRKKQLTQKLKSPMFKERFEEDNWKVFYFEILKDEYMRHKAQTKIENLLDKTPKVIQKKKNEKNEAQIELF